MKCTEFGKDIRKTYIKGPAFNGEAEEAQEALVLLDGGTWLCCTIKFAWRIHAQHMISSNVFIGTFAKFNHRVIK